MKQLRANSDFSLIEGICSRTKSWLTGEMVNRLLKLDLPVFINGQIGAGVSKVALSRWVFCHPRQKAGFTSCRRSEHPVGLRPSRQGFDTSDKGKPLDWVAEGMGEHYCSWGVAGPATVLFWRVVHITTASLSVVLMLRLCRSAPQAWKSHWSLGVTLKRAHKIQGLFF